MAYESDVSQLVRLRAEVSRLLRESEAKDAEIAELKMQLNEARRLWDANVEHDDEEIAALRERLRLAEAVCEAVRHNERMVSLGKKINDALAAWRDGKGEPA